MAQVYRDAKGNYVAVTADGRQVPVLPDMVKHGKITGFSPVQEEQGVTGFQRFTTKNLSGDPDAARGFLEKIGYEVRPYGGGFNFAVRPRNGGTNVPWKVVDPDGFDPQDILDLMGDALSLGAQTLAGLAVAPALATGPAGMAVEAGAVGAAASGVEAFKQAAGVMAGVPDNISLKNIGLAGAGGAASVPIQRAVAGSMKSAGRFLGRMARGVGARFAGIEGSKALPGADAMRAAAEWSVSNPGQLMRTPEQAAEIMRRAVKAIASKTFPEGQAASDIAKTAAGNGTTFNLRPLMDDIQAEMLMPTATINVPGQAKPAFAGRTPELTQRHGVEPTLQDNLERVVATIYAIVRHDNLPSLPIDRAVLIKNYLQQVARQKGAYTQTPPGRLFRDIMTRSAKVLKDQIETAMTNAGHADYVPTMRAFETKTALLHDWSKALRVKDTSREAAQARLDFVRSLYSDSKTNWLSGLDDLETTFGQELKQIGFEDLRKTVREMEIGRVTGMSQEGGPSLLGRGPRSTLGLGALVFGHPVVAGVELAVTSPKVVMGATKAGVAAAPVAGAVASGGARAGSLLVTQQAARMLGKGVSRDDAPKKKPTRIGM